MTTLRTALVAALVTAACTSAPSSGDAPAATGPPPAPTTTSRPTATATPTPTTDTSTPPSPSQTPTSTPPSPSPTPTDPPFRSEVTEVVGHPVEERMVGVSWREGCPVPLAQLRYVTVTHVDLDGAVREGELVVHEDVVDDVQTAMQRLYELAFPIEQMRLVADFGGDDDASMRANNTSAFNCRTVAGTDRWSNHAHGRAIDINPLFNPYVRGDDVDPPEGAPYADRDDHRPGMLHAGTPEVAALTDLGWDWGGTWSSGQDYQHFSASGG